MSQKPAVDSGKSQTSSSAFIWPSVAIAVGIYHVYTGTHSVVSLVWNIVLIVVGVIVLAFLAIAKSIGLDGTPATSASFLAKQQQQLFGGLHVYRAATDLDFTGLDRAFYDATTRRTAVTGLPHVGRLCQRDGLQRLAETSRGHPTLHRRGRIRHGVGLSC